MIRIKKIFLSVLTFSSLTVPMFSTIACGSCDDSNNNNNDKTGVNKLIDQTRQAMQDRANFISKTNTTTLPIENTNFQADFVNFKTALMLGLIFPSNALPGPSLLTMSEQYFVESVDLAEKKVVVKASITAQAGVNQITNSAFLTITNFSGKFDLASLPAISPAANDDNIFSAITNPKTATASQIQSALSAIAKEYLDAQVANLPQNDYTISDWKKGDGSPLADDDLLDNARSFQVKITATAGSSTLKNQATVMINFPKLNAFDVKTIKNFESPKSDWKVDDPSKVPSSYVIETVNKQILDLINKSNTYVKWDDLFAIYYVPNAVDPGFVMPQTLDLTNEYRVVLKLTALPFSKNARGEAIIPITLPALGSFLTN